MWLLWRPASSAFFNPRGFTHATAASFVSRVDLRAHAGVAGVRRAGPKAEPGGQPGSDRQPVGIGRLPRCEWTKSTMRAAKPTSCCSTGYSPGTDSIRIADPTCAN